MFTQLNSLTFFIQEKRRKRGRESKFSLKKNTIVLQVCLKFMEQKRKLRKQFHFQKYQKEYLEINNQGGKGLTC